MGDRLIPNIVRAERADGTIYWTTVYKRADTHFAFNKSSVVTTLPMTLAHTTHSLLDEAEMDVTTSPESPDMVSFNLVIRDSVVSSINIRYLDGKRLWAYWRGNMPAEELADGSPVPPGLNTTLQERILEAYPGWSMVSAKGELSPSGEAFRERFMRDHPETVWSMAELEGDATVKGATPRLTAEQVAEMNPPRFD